MKEIVVNEKIVVKDPVTTSEVVALPGIKGDKGDALTYDDFTPEQIADLKRPATEAAAVANAAAQRAEAAAESVQEAVEDAEQASQSAQQAATAAVEAVANANTAVESVNALEERVEQAEATRVQSETQRQTAETNRASSEQRREANETERQQKFAQIESDATSLENSLNEAEAQRETAENAREEAETQRETAEQNRETEFSEIKTEVGTLVTQTTEAKDAATEAATSATNAAEEANTAAGLANDAAELANQAADNVDGRVTALESKASEVYDNLAAIESSGETNPDKIYIDGETAQPYIYKDGKFVPFKGEANNKYYNDNIYIPFYKCSLPTVHKETEFAIPINGDLDDLFVFSYLNIGSSQIRRVKNGKVIWEILQNIYIGMLYGHTVNNDVVFYGNYAFVRGRITGLAKIDLSDGTVEFNKEVITEYENISLYKDYIIATGENKIVIIDPNSFSVYKQIDIEGGKTHSINSYADRVLISCSKNLYIIKDIDSDPIVISGSNITSAYYIKHLINSDVDSYLLYDSGITRLLTEDSSIDLTSNEIFNTLGFSPQFVINNSGNAGNAIIYCICHNGYLTIRGYASSISLLSKVSDFITYSRTEEIMKYFGEDYYIRRVGDIFYKVKIIGYAEN